MKPAASHPCLDASILDLHLTYPCHAANSPRGTPPVFNEFNQIETTPHTQHLRFSDSAGVIPVLLYELRRPSILATAQSLSPYLHYGKPGSTPPFALLAAAQANWLTTRVFRRRQIGITL
jgi:hypothetical protein